MFGKGSIDDLLGPAGDGTSGERARGGGWLREWPLLLGLACSLGLIGGAMLVDAPDGPPVAQAKASAATADYSAGQVVDVGEEKPADTAAADAAETPTDAERTQKKPKKPAAAKLGTSKPETTGGASAGSAGGESTAPRRRPTRNAPSGGGQPTTAKIVNVTGTSASITNGPLAYSLGAPSHSPVVGKPWRLAVSATRNGKPLAGKVKIDILHDGAIVGHASSGALRGGRFAHDFDWPKESVGHPLTVKTTVIGGGIQQSFLFDVKVKAAG